MNKSSPSSKLYTLVITLYNLNPEKYGRMQNGIEALTQKYNLRYYNYLNDERFTAEDYFDSDHLNTRGAEKFSRFLRDEIIEKYVSLQ